MFFDSISDFFNMGGHALYVWSSYGIFALVILVNFLSPMLTRKNVIKNIERQMRREQK